MITTLLHLVRLFPFLCGGHQQLAIENVALRHQLAVYKRMAGRPCSAMRVDPGFVARAVLTGPRNPCSGGRNSVFLQVRQQPSPRLLLAGLSLDPRGHAMITEKMLLRTPSDVIGAVGPRGPEYFDITPFTDAAGFSVKRRYPDTSSFAAVVTRSGDLLVACMLRLVVDPSTSSGGISRVRVSVNLHRPWNEWNAQPHDFNDPTAPTPDSWQRFERARKPVSLDFDDDFVYDSADGTFRDENGAVVTGRAILDYVYDYHCRTLARRAALRYNVKRATRWLVERAV